MGIKSQHRLLKEIQIHRAISLIYDACPLVSKLPLRSGFQLGFLAYRIACLPVVSSILHALNAFCILIRKDLTVKGLLRFIILYQLSIHELLAGIYRSDWGSQEGNRVRWRTQA
jgi:hypothetical protein